MIFQRKISVIILTTIFIIFYCISIFRNHSFHINTLIMVIYSTAITFLLSTYIKVEDGKLTKYLVFIKTYEISINHIQIIEAITRKQFGQIIINFGKSPTEDYFELVMKDKTRYRIDKYYMKNGHTLGRYLNKEYKIQLKEKDKMTYIGNGV